MNRAFPSRGRSRWEWRASTAGPSAKSPVAMRPEGTRVFLAHVGPRGRALVDKRLYLHREWTQDPERCAAADVPEAACAYQTKPELALSLLRRARQRGELRADWVTGDYAYGE